MKKFDLWEDPWIPVFWGDEVRDVGLTDLLLHAQEITRLELYSPLEEAAVLRLVMAVLHRALQGPRDLDDLLDWWDIGAFPREPIEAYRERYAERFYLFHPEAPFYQVPDLPEDASPSPWILMYPGIDRNTPTLFSHHHEGHFPTATYAEALRALLVHQMFMPGGLLRRWNVTSLKRAPLADAAAFLPLGANLFETLLMHLVDYNPADDMPIWEHPPLRLGDVRGYATEWPLRGLARVYTWMTRGVRLLDEGHGVRFVVMGPGVRPVEVPFRDPMVGYQRTKKGELRPLRMNLERSFWRDFQAMLPALGGSLPSVLVRAGELQREIPALSRRGLHVVGLVTDRAKILDMRREMYPLPALEDPKVQEDLARALELAENVGKKLHGVGKEVVRHLVPGGDPGDTEKWVNALLARVYWSELDKAFPRFLHEIQDPGALNAWKGQVRQAVYRAWESCRQTVGHSSSALKALGHAERHLRRLTGMLLLEDSQIREVSV